MRNKLKIFITALACLGLAGNLFSQQAVTGMGGGTGTSADPYQISTSAHLTALSNWVKAVNQTNNCSGTYFKVMNDIDMSSVPNFVPIGGRDASNKVEDDNTSYVFSGIFDGNGKTISNLTINAPGKAAFFGGIGWSGFVCKNLTIDNASITSSARRTGVIFGGGKSSGSSVVQNCIVKNSTVIASGEGYAGILGGEDQCIITGCGVINSTLICSGGNYYGGLIGDGDGNSLVSKCYVTGCLIEGTNSNYLGGMFGDVDLVIARNCYVTNTIVRTLTSSDKIGGFTGGAFSASSTNLSRCYSTAIVERLAGSTVTNVGGFLGYPNASTTISECSYIDTWNTEGLPSSDQGTMRTAAEMQAAAFVTTLNTGNADGTGTWTSDNNLGFTRVNGGFPILAGVTSNTGTIPCPYQVHNGETLTIPSNYSGQWPCKIIVTYGGTLINNDANFTDANMPDLVIQDGGSFYNSTATDRKGRLESDLIVGRWNLRSHPFASAITLMPFSRDTATIGLDNMNSRRLLIAAHDYDFATNNWKSTYLHRTNTFPVKRSLFFWPYTSGGGVTATAGSIVTCYMDGATYGNLYNETGSIAVPSELLGTNVSGGTTKGRWMPLGNPYPGRIYANKFIAENSGKIQGNVIYRWNPATSAWDTYSSSSQYIRAGEGFVVAISGNPSSYTFSKNHMIMAQADKSVSPFDLAPIYLAATANNLSKQACLRLDREADNGFDPNDAYALFGRNEDMVEPYFAVGGEGVVINAFRDLPYITPVNMHAAKAGAVKLEMSNLPSGMEATLIDLQQGTSRRLDRESARYETLVESGENSGRFVLVLTERNTPAEKLVEQIILDHALQACIPYVGNKNAKYY